MILTPPFIIKYYNANKTKLLIFLLIIVKICKINLKINTHKKLLKNKKINKKKLLF